MPGAVTGAKLRFGITVDHLTFNPSKDWCGGAAC